MPPKHLMFHVAARRRFARGVDVLADAVGVTYGPRGRAVTLPRRYSPPRLTRSGVAVAREVELSDRFEHMGAQMLKEAASKTFEIAGDGTTTTTILARAMAHEGVVAAAAGADPLAVKRGLDLAVAATVDALRKLARPCASKQEMGQVARLAANGDAAIGEIVAEAIARVGHAGVIAVEDGNGCDDEVEVVAGMQFECGYLSPAFVTDRELQRAQLRAPYILLHDRPLTAVRPLLPILKAVAHTGAPLLVIAPSIEDDALASLVVNGQRGILTAVAVQAPGSSDQRKSMLEDIAVLTGGRVISEQLGRSLETATLADLGRARSIAVERTQTTLIGGAGDDGATAQRARQLYRQAGTAGSGTERQELLARAAKLSGGVALIKAGAVTENARQERLARIENAVRATRAAVEEGTVPGGGVALLRAADAMATLRGESHGEDVGIALVRRALKAPLQQIAASAGADPQAVLAAVGGAQGAFGFDASTGTYGDLFALGVVDPVKVVRTALQNAASIARLVLATEAMVADEAPQDALR